MFHTINKLDEYSMTDTFIQKLFCGGVIRDRDDAGKSLIACKNMIMDFSITYQTMVAKIDQLTQVNVSLKAAVESWVKEANAYKAQIEVLEKTAIPHNLILEYLEDPILYDVYDVLDTSKYQFVLAADVEYNVFSYQQWGGLLGEVYSRVKAKWETDIWDCDNVAEFMHAYISQAMKDAGQKKQGMVGIAWSKSHAYLVFMALDEKWYIYEPQTDVVVGGLGDDGLEELYVTRLLLFIH